MNQLFKKYHHKMIWILANRFILGKNDLETTIDKMCHHFDRLIRMEVKEELKKQ